MKLSKYLKTNYLIILLFIVIINTKISDKAIKNANKQKSIIEECIDKLEKEK